MENTSDFVVPVQTKRLRITTSDGSSKTLDLPLEATYSDLQLMVENELHIPCNEQILRSGIPPKIMVPPSDATHPVDLQNGDRVTVERSIKTAVSSEQEEPGKSDTQLSSM